MWKYGKIHDIQRTSLFHYIEHSKTRVILCYSRIKMCIVHVLIIDVFFFRKFPENVFRTDYLLRLVSLCPVSRYDSSGQRLATHRTANLWFGAF